ncbi:hypothetical protein B7494_g6173 [Chlorociboria aeruginascens]|nr:hypothetical protein B7494_g6173 [Chlorociboria aeruginascens]
MWASKSISYGVTALLLALRTAALNASAIAPLISQLSAGTQVFYPTDANWTNETVQRWTEFSAPTFFASIKPTEVSDVQKIVTYAGLNSIQFLASGGGHGYTTTYGVIQSGLEIDLTAFNSVVVNVPASTLTVGGGTHFRDIFNPLYDAGKELQTGSGSCVGVLGATLGAGVGRYQGLHGLIIDSLLSVDVVIGNGSLITASKAENPELFWGIRGAGFNYGIVVEATFEAHNLTNGGSVLNADFKFAPSLNGTYFEILKSFEGNLPAPLSLFTLVVYDDEFGPVIILNAAYAGPEDEGLAIIQPFLDLPFLERNITQLTWNVLDTSALFGLDAGFCINGGLHNMWALGVGTIDVPTHVAFFTVIVDFLNANPDVRTTSYEVEFFASEGIIAVPDDATAYPHRDIIAHVMLTFGYASDNRTEEVNQLAETWISNFNATSGFDELQVYVNYAHGTEGLDAMYGKRKLDRLLALKAEYDPQGLFVFNNPLPIPGKYKN